METNLLEDIMARRSNRASEGEQLSEIRVGLSKMRFSHAVAVAPTEVLTGFFTTPITQDQLEAGATAVREWLEESAVEQSTLGVTVSYDEDTSKIIVSVRSDSGTDNLAVPCSVAILGPSGDPEQPELPLVGSDDPLTKAVAHDGD